MILLSTVKVGASIRLVIVSENNTVGVENVAEELGRIATQISKTVFGEIGPFKNLV